MSKYLRMLKLHVRRWLIWTPFGSHSLPLKTHSASTQQLYCNNGAIFQCAAYWPLQMISSRPSAITRARRGNQCWAMHCKEHLNGFLTLTVDHQCYLPGQPNPMCPCLQAAVATFSLACWAVVATVQQTQNTLPPLLTIFAYMQVHSLLAFRINSSFYIKGQGLLKILTITSQYSWGVAPGHVDA